MKKKVVEAPAEEERTLVWAHRGASAYAPENTIDAFKKAMKMKADGVELDVQLSRDGELVVIHDETIDRTSGEHGFVRDFTLDELKKFNVSHVLPSYGSRTRIPTLQEVFELLANTEMTINVELKNGIYPYPGLEEKVIRLIREMDMVDRVWISSFNHPAVLEAKRLCPQIRCGLLLTDILADPVGYAKSLNVEALHPAQYHWEMDEKLISKAAREGLKTHIWTVNDANVMRKLANAGVEAIITNYPDIARDIVCDL